MRKMKLLLSDEMMAQFQKQFDAQQQVNQEREKLTLDLKTENHSKEQASTQVKELLVDAASKRVFAVGDTGKTEPIFLEKSTAADIHSTGSDD